MILDVNKYNAGQLERWVLRSQQVGTLSQGKNADGLLSEIFHIHVLI